MHVRNRLSGCGHNSKWNAFAIQGKTMAEDGLGLVLLQRGSLSGDRVSIT